MPTEPNVDEMHQMLDRLLQQVEQSQAVLPDDDTPLGMLTREFFANNWSAFCENLLSRTTVLRMIPEPSPAPREFYFEIDRPYKSKHGDHPVRLMPGPIRGKIFYRPDLFLQPDEPYVAVQLDPRLDYFHPNCDRQRGGLLCLGVLPKSPFPLPLDLLMEDHVYPIVTYQNVTPSDALDRDAAMYFALDPDAQTGLRPVAPLY